MDVLYLVRPGAANEELRYSLRSIAANLPHERVWLVGAKPPWVAGVEHVPPASTGDKWTNLPAELAAAARHAGLADEITYFNDDIFVLEPLDRVPVLHRGPLAEEVARSAMSAYRRGQAQTLELLRTWGHPDPLSYELHVPLPMEREPLAEILEWALAQRSYVALAYRSLYGNAAAIGGDLAGDVKVHSRQGTIPPGSAFVSTNDDSFANGRVGTQVRALFPEPCRYEA